jgi:iron complex outermembrane receptor protein
MIASLSRGNANLGELKTRGLDLTFAYRFPRTVAGQFNVRSESTYTDTFRIKSNATANWENDAGEFTYNRVKSNLTLDWNLGNWSATLASRYYSGVKVHCWSAANNEECSNPNDPASWGTGYTKFGAMVYSDLSIGYALPWKAKLLAGANNVFDRKPRIVYDANSSFANGTSSSSSVDPQMPIDRLFYVRYNQSF